MYQILVFACQRRIPEKWRPPFAPEDIKGEQVRVIQLPCSAKLRTLHMLRPFERGVDGVLVMTCGRDNCKSIEGSRRAAMRVREANNILDEVGLGSSRVLLQQADGNAEDLFMQALDELLTETKALGTNPVRGTS